MEVPEFAEVEVGEVAGFRVSGTDLLVCRSGDDSVRVSRPVARCVSTRWRGLCSNA